MERELPSDQQELLDAYFTGSLNDDMLLAIDKLLAEDESFREAFEFQSDVCKALVHQDQADFRATLLRIESQSDRKINRLPARWTAAIAAALLLIATWLFYPSNPQIDTESTLVSHYFTPQANIHFPITRNTASNTLAYRAFSAYETQDWPMAESLLDSAIRSDNRSEMYLYLANVYMAEGRFGEAIPLLEHFRISGDAHSDRASWYLALCHVAIGKSNQAKTYLNETIERRAYPYERAQELLYRLQSEN
jgi:tetratricopeptide (TPR) repeat protein